MIKSKIIKNKGMTICLDCNELKMGHELISGGSSSELCKECLIKNVLKLYDDLGDWKE